jgi:tRNA(Ile)-lysidine synthase
LRGDESEEDERWLYGHCASLCVPLKVKQFDTQSMQIKMGGSVQLVARKLRYAWFDEILYQYPGSIICTAHHFDDTVEQMFMHLMRSGSLLDLQAIPEERPGYYRPFLHFKKSEIVRYLSEKGIAWREDSSNKKNDYTRNKIRNQLLPLMQEIDARSNLALTRFRRETSQLHEDLERQIETWLGKQQNRNAFLMPFSVWDNSLRIWKQKFILILTHIVFSENELEKLRLSENGAMLKIGPYSLKINPKTHFLIAKLRCRIRLKHHKVQCK